MKMSESHDYDRPGMIALLATWTVSFHMCALAWARRRGPSPIVQILRCVRQSLVSALTPNMTSPSLCHPNTKVDGGDE
jgi:hypothetical protein